MSELHRSHSAYELQEQRVLEQYWPVGPAAENLRAVLIAKLIAQRIDYDESTEADIERIWKKLEGTFDPERDLPRKGIPPPEQMKYYF